jgi:hypothetical protein
MNITYRDGAENVDLIKWPAFVVRGDKVDKLTAYEILVRTDSFYLSCNDKMWERRARGIVGFPPDKWSPKTAEQREAGWRQEDAARKELGQLPLGYIQNSQIMSSWIGGPCDGWMNWDGTIQNPPGKNIGKHPSVVSVAEDWAVVASEWPILNLRCQLWNCEAWYPSEDEEPRPVVEFVVSDGRVLVMKPAGVLAWPQNSQISFGMGCSEAGVDAATLQEAVAHVRKVRAAR